MKILITGINGQLGYDVAKQLLQKNYEVIGCGSSLFNKTDLDIKYVRFNLSDGEDIRTAIDEIIPDVIIHCAAWTNVDAAELNENKAKVHNINAIGTYWLVQMAKKYSAKFVYISTDYVFNGTGTKPWAPFDNNFDPLNFYGFTKWQGELFVQSLLEKYFIIRTSWVFGINGNNFIKTILKLSETHSTLNVVDDQIGRPTYTYDLAQFICQLIETEKYGCYHASNEGDFISWYDFAREIFKQSNINCKVFPVSTEQYNLNKNIAMRPKNSRLDTNKILTHNFDLLPTWNDALERYLYELSKRP